jgi:hypothetical protein
MDNLDQLEIDKVARVLCGLEYDDPDFPTVTGEPTWHKFRGEAKRWLVCYWAVTKQTQ